MDKAIEYLPETNHEEIHKKEALKVRARKLGLDVKTTTEEQLYHREGYTEATQIQPVVETASNVEASKEVKEEKPKKESKPKDKKAAKVEKPKAHKKGKK